MLIDALIDFYDRNSKKLAPHYHRFYQVTWLLELDRTGKFRNLISTDLEMVIPMSNRTSGVLAHLVVDGADYVLCINAKKKRHQAYRDCIAAATQILPNTPLDALLAFLTDEYQVEKAREEAEKQNVKPKELILPVIDGEMLAAKRGVNPISLHNTLHEVWLHFMEKEYGADKGLCFFCGSECIIQDRHAKASVLGEFTSLVNMNKSAFMSHGLANSTNAPMCIRCVSKYVAALAYLADKKNIQNRLVTRMVRGSNNRVVEQSGWLAWLRQEAEVAFFDFAKQDNPEDALASLRAIYKKHPFRVQHKDFYAVALTVSDKRIAVRSFLTLSLEKALEHIEGYFERQAVNFNGHRRTFNLYTLLEAASSPNKDGKPDRGKLPPTFADALVEHILTCQSLPATLRDAALRRCRVERDVPAARAALLKLILLSNRPTNTTMATEHLNEHHPNPAYHCGRLLAVADSVYYATTQSEGYVSKRYYSSAATAPASVYGRIIPNVHHQLKVLQRKKAGHAVNLDKLITQIMGRIQDTFPKTLPAIDQAIFALGFYHQRDHLMTSKKTEEKSAADANEQSDS